MAKRKRLSTSNGYPPAKNARNRGNPGSNVVTRSRKASAEGFPYTPLDSGQIRLLVLEAGAGDDAIRGELYIALLDDNPKYTALSYRWGDPEKTRCINIFNDQLSVTENLYVALRCLRRKDADFVLWVDAICINQVDLEERSQQVSIMDSIYKRSTYVFAFTGESEEDTEIGINLLRELGSVNKSTSQFDECVTDAGDLEHPLRPWPTLAHLIDRSYFTRIWVIQELALNSENTFVYFGQHSLPLADYTAGFWAIARVLRGLFDAHSRNAISLILGVGWQPGLPMMKLLKNWSVLTLTESIEYTRYFGASDSRDYVYSLLSLANIRERQLIRPNYEQTYEQFRAEIARLLLDGSCDLECIRGNRHDPSDRSYMEPSWALPALSTPGANLAGRDAKWQMPRRASGKTSRVLKYSADYRCLSLFGVYLDTVKSITGPHRKGYSRCNNFDYMERIASIVKCPRMRRRLWRVLLMDSWLTWDPLSEESSMANHISIPVSRTFKIGLDDLVSHRKTTRPSLARTNKANRVKTFSDQVLGLTFDDRCFFVTESGRMGIGPRATKCGDAVVIFYSAGYCHMLRPRDTQYILLGDAYVDGVMEGEFMDSPESADREMWFELR